MSDLTIYSGVSRHLAAVPDRGLLVCPLCRRGEPLAEPMCERCGQPVGHFECYVAALPPGPEREFFTLPEEPDYLGIFLCRGCRS